MGGPVELRVSSSVSYTNTISESTSVTVGAEMEAGVIFESAKVSTEISQSLSYTWSTTSSDDVSTSFACHYYDNGEAFKGGCMW